jgi:hypothetical protein
MRHEASDEQTQEGIHDERSPDAQGEPHAQRRRVRGQPGFAVEDGGNTAIAVATRNPLRKAPPFVRGRALRMTTNVAVSTGGLAAAGDSVGPTTDPTLGGDQPPCFPLTRSSVRAAGAAR